MKKLTLSAVMFATLTSFAAYADYSQQDINIDAEITDVVSLVDSHNAKLGSMTLTRDLHDSQLYSSAQTVQLKTTNPGDVGVNIYLERAPTLIANAGNLNEKAFTALSVSLDAQELEVGLGGAATFNKDVDFNLVVSATVPNNASTGERYTGIIPLMLESAA
ncbi:CS1 type fimbrial major subunit [Yersinia nurmii]|uniref:CS1 type fimbrial major subunit n=1 Tax=Yersinia nurmii TaxID=685706 RepID=A0AAW7KAB2_9GAMM|nr:CS1 type fimbrial major subunit [Yersinia nurmii]MDN0089364.1 CS1 type fimbrial major subunit [Yersinia nurmii]CNF03512.1 Uncharacterised protein [Yersinia nurmii]